jgi:cytochrome c
MILKKSAIAAGGIAAICAAFALEPSIAYAAGAQQSKQGSIPAVVRKSDCLSCHSVKHKIVGPAYTAVAKRYAKKQAAKRYGGHKSVVKMLMAKIKHGVSGHWGSIPMPAHPNLTKQQLHKMVTWVLSLNNGKGQAKAAAGAPSGKTYTYKNRSGKTIKLDFPAFANKKKNAVTHAVFRGYELYNSYCFRCHGPDAVGGEYAPDLRTYLNQGASYRQFLSVAMTGRPAKGMPSWAGFFKPKQIRTIYEYVKARATELVPTGRPKSPGD